MLPDGLAVLPTSEGEDRVRLRPRYVQLNRPAPCGPMVQRNLDPILRQCDKALLSPFDGRYGLAGEIFDQPC